MKPDVQGVTAVILFLIGLTPATARGQEETPSELFSQTTPYLALIGKGNTGGWLADDFVVPEAEEWEITQVLVTGAARTSDFTLAFFEDSGGLPGAPVYGESGLPASSVIPLGSVGGMLVSSYLITLPEPAILREGGYWLGLDVSSGAFFWQHPDADLLFWESSYALPVASDDGGQTWYSPVQPGFGDLSLTLYGNGLCAAGKSRSAAGNIQRWIGGSAGSFSTDTNWANDEVPGSDDIAVFDLSQALVSFNQDVTNAAMRVRRFPVALDLGGHTYSLLGGADCGGHAVLIDAVTPSTGLSFRGGTLETLGLVELRGSAGTLERDMLTVRGAGRWLLGGAGALTLGNGGKARVSLVEKSRFENFAGQRTRIGVGPGGEGQVLLTDSSTWITAGPETETILGAEGGAGSMRLTSASRITGWTFALGQGAGSKGVLDVKGTGAGIRLQDLIVGEGGEGLVEVSEGAALDIDQLVVGHGEGYVELLSGAQGVVRDLFLATTPGSSGGFTVKGSGTRVDVPDPLGSLVVGQLGQGVLRIEEGATMNLFALTLLVGEAPGSLGFLAVTEFGSELNALATVLRIGVQGNGGFIASGGSYVTSFQGIIGGGVGNGIGGASVRSGSIWQTSSLEVAPLSVLQVSSAGVVITGTLVALGTVDPAGGTLFVGVQPPPPQPPPPSHPQQMGVGAWADTSGTIYADTLIIGEDSELRAGSIMLAEGGYIGGTGVFPLDLINTGTISPGDSTGTAGTFRAGADYTQADEGLLEIELGGPSEGDYDRLDVTGTATLGGTLRLRLTNNFVPEAGQRFEIVRAGSLEGSFAVVEEHPQVAMDVTYSATGVTLTVLTVTAIEQPGGEGDAEGDEQALPSSYALEPNYPNPFNPRTVLRYAVPRASAVRLTVYDALGREVAVLVEGQRPSGRHEVVFEAGSLPSGVYLARLVAGGRFIESRALLLMK